MVDKVRDGREATGRNISHMFIITCDQHDRWGLLSTVTQGFYFTGEWIKLKEIVNLRRIIDCAGNDGLVSAS